MHKKHFDESCHRVTLCQNTRIYREASNEKKPMKRPKSGAKSKTNGVPELELGEATDERPELIRSASGEARSVHEVLHLRIHLRGQEPDQEVQHVDPDGVGHDVEPLDEVDSDEVDEGEPKEGDPAVEHVRNRLVEEVPVPLRQGEDPPRQGGGSPLRLGEGCAGGFHPVGPVTDAIFFPAISSVPCLLSAFLRLHDPARKEEAEEEEERMDARAMDPSNQSSPQRVSEQTSAVSLASQTNTSPQESPSLFSASGITSWAKNLKLPQNLANGQENSGFSTLSRFATEIRSHLPSATSTTKDGSQNSPSGDSSVLESLTKGFVDSSRSAVKAVQVKARHIVSQNKRRYQEGEFDLDLTYITDNIIAMGFPAGDISSGIFGYIEGFYRNHMEEVIRFFETHHPGNYKVYNLCSERLYDASLFKGKVAHFPFDDHNCPPIQLILSFCQSACSWLKEDIQNVVVVHCKAGMARTGLMICSLLLYLKFPTAEEAMSYYNEKRCIDAKALVLPSQIRYVKYFENILMHFKGETPPGRRCMLRGFKLQDCPYWIRPSITISNHNGVLFTTKKHPKTKDLMPEDFWIRSTKKGIVIFALPGEPGLTELTGDFKIHFHDHHGDFYCWLNTTMMENRMNLNSSDLDGFDKRKLPSPAFQLEIVMVDYDESLHSKAQTGGRRPSNSSEGNASSGTGALPNPKAKKASRNEEDDVFSDSEGDDGTLRNRHTRIMNDSKAGPNPTRLPHECSSQRVHAIQQEPDQQRHLENTDPSKADSSNSGIRRASEFKVVAADASVFTFGDEEDYESE
ncbi:hypothetical protein SAY87_008438 [Trapa incisa]|uniref:Uncharacterized protein n=1 Tax=Trapa incisa TaxID=236973 RepID=A0AAN7KGQ5_9MYRT|nr:hypothetical protein SAY87_008438 [Trapa incisa]